MEKEQSKRTGRPTKPAEAGKRVSLGLKVSPQIKSRLDDAARRTGRSQSLEAEFRLEQTFRDQALLDQVLELAYGPPLAGILMLLAAAMELTGRQVGFESTGTLEGAEHWYLDPWSFEQVAKAAQDILEVLRPVGDVVSPSSPKGGNPDFDDAVARYFESPGSAWANRAIIDMFRPDGNRELSEDLTTRIRSLLGQIVENAKKQLALEDEERAKVHAANSARPGGKP